MGLRELLEKDNYRSYYDKDYKPGLGRKVLVQLIVVVLLFFVVVEVQSQENQLGQYTNQILSSALASDNDWLPEILAVFSGQAPSSPAIKFELPVSGIITKSFTNQAGQIISDHVAIKTSAGQQIKAAAAGQVVQAEADNQITIDHGLGFTSSYGNLSHVFMQVGDTVKAGTAIGVAGETEITFAIFYNGKPVNPLTYLEQQQTDKSV